MRYCSGIVRDRDVLIGVLMEAPGSISAGLQEVGRLSGIRQPGSCHLLSNFQFVKEKRKHNSQKKIFSNQRLFENVSTLSSGEPVTQAAGAEAAVNTPSAAQSNQVKKFSNLESWHLLATIVQRLANVLNEDSSNAKRCKCLAELKEIFIECRVPHTFYDRAFPLLLAPLLLCLSDPTEVARQRAACLLYKFLEEVTEVDEAFGVVLRGLVPRFAAEDIDGVTHLPPIMRPDPEYKPLQLTPAEKSEEVRRTLFQVLRTLLDRSSDETVWSHLDLATSVLRAGAMDVCPEIKTAALYTLVEFCDRHQHMLLHFAEPLTRALLSCLVHQHARIKMGALWALTHVIACGVYKYTGEIIQTLAGWRDPNFVPVKSLYETTTIRNYFAELRADQSAIVRMFFFDTLARWLLEFKDKADYETWVLPYLLSGLFDAFRPIQQLVFKLMERLGAQYEVDHEKDLRDIKQLGALEPWNYEGKASIKFPLGGRWQVAQEAGAVEEKNQFAAFVRSYGERLRSLGFTSCSLSGAHDDMYLTETGALVGDPARPCLGTRMMVKTYFRRYANTLFQPVEDFKEVTTVTSARLMVISLAYIEDSCVEWLHGCLTICSRVLSSAEYHSPEAVEAYQVAARLIGVFIDPNNFWDFVKDVFESECFEETHQRLGMVELLALMLEGSFKTLRQASDSTLGLGRLASVVPQIAEALARTDLLNEQLISSSAQSIAKLVEVLVSGALQQRHTFSAETWYHLISVVSALRLSDSDEGDSVPSHIQKILSDLGLHQSALTDGKTAPTTGGSIWLSAGLSKTLPPSNLAALSTFLRCLPVHRLLEEDQLSIAILQLRHFSEATQPAETRRRATRAALRLVTRLLELDSAENTATRERATSRENENGVLVPLISAQQAEDAFSKAGDHAGEKENAPDFGEFWKRAQAAAGILTDVVLSRARKLDCPEDLEDTLAALVEFLIACQPETWTALQDALITSGFIKTVGWLLCDPHLHTKLFRRACETYAHESAATYPDKSPAMILQDMPLGKRRQLRLAAIKTAAEIKNQAVLLLRVALVVVLRHDDALKHIIKDSVASLHPPSKLQKVCGAAASSSENDFDPEPSCSRDICGEFGREQGEPSERNSAAVSSDTALRCSASLPFQVQGPWLLFHVASCLHDALLYGTLCHMNAGKPTESAPMAGGLSLDWRFPLLTMPGAWQLPTFSHLQLQTARQRLLCLTSDADLCQTVDSCVRHIVELQNGLSGVLQKPSSEPLEEPPRHSKADWNLRELVIKAKSQNTSLPVAVQKHQTRLALIQVLRLIMTVYPGAVQECLRQYEDRGRFSRREILAQLIEDHARHPSG